MRKTLSIIIVAFTLIFVGSVVLAQDSLVAHYGFEGNFRDRSGNDLHGTPLNGATIAWDAARGSNVLVVDGDSATVDLGNSALFDWNGSGWSVAFWVKLNSWDENWQTALKKGDAFAFERDFNNDQLQFFFQPAGGSNFLPRVVPLVGDSSWHHIAGTYDGTDQSIYLDGELFDTVNNPGAMPIKPDDNVYIGSTGHDRYFNGCFDDVRFYSKALTEAEVAALAGPNADTTLVAHYGFEGNYNDDSGNTLDGTPSGGAAIVWDDVRGSNVFVADGDSAEIDLGNSMLFDWSGGWSVAFWVKLNSWDENWQTAIKKGDSYSFERDFNNDSLQFFFQGSEGSAFSPRKVDLVPDGTWHHIAGTYDGTDQSIYLDGELFDTVSNPGAMPITTDNITIGSAGGNRYFNGCFDDVRFYNKALTEEEVAALAVPPVDPNLVAHYPFEGDFNDASGNDLHGTPVNGATTAWDDVLGSNVLVVDGDSATVDLGNSMLFDWNGSGWSAAFWVKLNSWDENWQTALKKGDAYSFERDFNNDQLQFFFQGSEGSAFSPRIVDLVPDSTWHHIAGTYDGVDQNIYFDGELFDTVNNPGAMPIKPDNVFIGSTGKDRYFNGCFDDVRFYNKALTEEEVAVLAERMTTSVDESDLLLPVQYNLAQNYPNPFNPTTTLEYALAERSLVSIIVYDLLGRKVRTLVNGTQNAGKNSVIWDGKNEFSISVSSGVYIYKIVAGEFSETRKMLLMK